MVWYFNKKPNKKMERLARNIIFAMQQMFFYAPDCSKQWRNQRSGSGFMAEAQTGVKGNSWLRNHTAKQN